MEVNFLKLIEEKKEIRGLGLLREVSEFSHTDSSGWEVTHGRMWEQCLLRPQFLKPKTRYQKQSLGAQDHWGYTFHNAGPRSELRKPAKKKKKKLKNPRDHTEKWEPRFSLEKA